ncbi:hypothetical protein CH063_09178 [Colletotrichum higginsianum]|uniref:Uncharacterized protein n=2 Tax=Colletotrichum higginsianum TaxID=80884 RepID=H1VCL0_COLHI|nr:hypothetical protein CH63R_13401 [Colletotrichum higginsianum IMI 349063]OBR04274.1 hypothetical protein CH63R_13401 [Colletotrichum higginsianum IMI 349063]CCF37963.1 hypothetical protein CH063_09178 [Colletotrichum higginsianum]
MCHGHPRWHPCSHTSINWHYCPSAMIDLETGVETPCSHVSYATAQPSNTDCPLLNCQFKAMGGTWTCCQCGQGPNDQGWCTMPKRMPDQNYGGIAADETRTCDHGCCAECTRYLPTRAATPDMTFGELRKGTASRKFGYGSATRSHRRGSALSKINGFLPVDEEVETTSPSTSGSSSRSSVSHKSSVSSSTSCRSSASAGRGSAHRADLEYSSKRHKSSSGKSTKKSQKSLRSH